MFILDSAEFVLLNERASKEASAADPWWAGPVECTVCAGDEGALSPSHDTVQNLQLTAFLSLVIHSKAEDRILDSGSSYS